MKKKIRFRRSSERQLQPRETAYLTFGQVPVGVAGPSFGRGSVMGVSSGGLRFQREVSKLCEQASFETELPPEQFAAEILAQTLGDETLFKLVFWHNFNGDKSFDLAAYRTAGSVRRASPAPETLAQSWFNAELRHFVAKTDGPGPPATN